MTASQPTSTVILYKQEQLPVLQNRVFDTADQARHCVCGDVILTQDTQTGLIHNIAFDPGLMVYDENYQNEQACSGVFRRHLDHVADIVARHASGRPILEIGCGKGWFLELLRSRGLVVSGVDPAYEGDAVDVIKAPFTETLGIRADVIVLRHVLEHIPDPLAFLRNIAAANGGEGLIYVEVPCFDWVLQHRAWFDIFYEHVNYFRPSDWSRWFDRVIEAGHLFGDQYQYVVADLSSLRFESLRDSAIEFPVDFLSSLDRGIAMRASATARRAVIWGAASKGVIYAIAQQQRGIDVDFAIDINPAKQGKYLPVSGLKVLSPDEASNKLSPHDFIFVMNSNYLDEIKSATRNQFHYIPVDA